MIKITGPSTGSSLMTIEREPHHQRFIIRLSTDFGTAHGVFQDAQAAEIANAIQSLLPAPLIQDQMVMLFLDAATAYLKEQYGASYGLDNPIDRERILHRAIVAHLKNQKTKA